MAVTILERPYKCSWSKNDIRYVFQLDTLQRLNLRLQVKLLWSRPLPVAYQELYTFTLKPDINGIIYFYFNDFLDSVLDYVLPDMEAPSMFTSADNQCCIFTINYRELSDGVDAPAFDLTEQVYSYNDYRMYCIKGGIEKLKHSRNNFFLQYNMGKMFMTWQPTDRMIDTGEVVFLSILNPSYVNGLYNDNYMIRIMIEDVNGGSYIQDYNFDKQCLFYHVRISLARINTGGLFVSQLYKMQMQLIDRATTYGLMAYNVYFEFRPVYKFYDLVYHNSLGGIDYVRVKGDVNESFEREMEEAVSGFDVNDWNANYKSADNIYSSLTVTRKYKGDIGYLRNKKQQYAFIELLLSKSMYMRTNYRWVPVISLQKTQDTGQARAMLNNFPIEWALSESNEAYTPLDYSLPKGDLT